MRKTGKERARAEFSRRLNEFIETRHLVPIEGRQAWLYNTVRNARSEIAIKVERTTIQKWLLEQSIPDQAHLAQLCQILGCNPNWLLIGSGPMYVIPETPSEIDTLWAQLEAGNRAKVIEYADLLRKSQIQYRESPGLEDRQARKS